MFVNMSQNCNESGPDTTQIEEVEKMHKRGHESGAHTTLIEVERMHKGGDDDVHFHLQPLIDEIQDIFSSMVPLVQSKGSRLPQLRQDLGEHRWTIGQLSWKMRCNFHDKEDARDTVLDLFACLKKYLWEEKSVLILAAFALSYVDFWRLAVQSLSGDPLEEKLLYFMQPPCLDQATLEVVNEVVKYMLEIAKSMSQITLLKSQETSSTIQNIFKVASFMIVKSVVACYSHIMALIKTSGDGTPATEILDIQNILKNVITIHEQVKEYGYQIFVADVEGEYEGFFDIVKFHIENSSIARNGKVVNLDELKGKTLVGFLISDVDTNENEYSNLKKEYAKVKELSEKRNFNYEIVWIPMADQLNVTEQKATSNFTEEIKGAFQRGSSSMPWYSLTQPAMHGEFRVRYIREKWKFESEPILIDFSGPKKFYRQTLSTIKRLGPRILPLSMPMHKLKKYPVTNFNLPQDPPQKTDWHEKAPKKDHSKSPTEMTNTKAKKEGIEIK